MSDKKRINQIAKETGLTNAELVSAAQTLGFEVKSHSSSVTAEQAEKIIQSAKQALTKLLKLLKNLLKKVNQKLLSQQRKTRKTIHALLLEKQLLRTQQF